MASEPIDIRIKTTYDSDGADDAIEDAKKLEKLDPIIEVEADTADAKSDIEGVTDSAQALMDRNPWIAEVLSDTSAAKSDLESLQGELKNTGDKADDTKRHIDKIGDTGGPRLAGNQVADLTGPFGDASGAASNFGGVFDGLADISEKVATKMGLNAAAMASAVSGIGFAVAGAAAVWTIYKQKQEEAKKKAAEHLKIQGELNDAIAKGDTKVAAQKFIELYGKVIELGKKAGLTTNEVVDAIRGVGDAAPEATGSIAEINLKLEDLRKTRDELAATAGDRSEWVNVTNVQKQIDALEDQRDAVEGAGKEFGDLTQKQKDNEAIQGAVQSAFEDTTTHLDDTAAAAERAKKKADDLTAAFDELKGNIDIKRQSEDMAADFDAAFFTIHSGMQPTLEDLRGLEDDILEAGRVAGTNPIDIEMTLKKISEGDLAGAHADAQSWLNQHALTVKIEANAKQVQSVIDKIRNPFAPSGTSAPAGLTTVNVNLPRGARQGDIARAMNLGTRHHGRRYGQVLYARR